jgi:fused signal recognition particle receptor
MASLWQRLKSGLKKSSDKISENIKHIFVSKKIDQNFLDEIEETLIMADLGVSVSKKIRDKLSKEKLDQELSEQELKLFIADHIADIIHPSQKNLVLNPDNCPHIVMVIGVNGAGKTTTISKLTHVWQSQSLSVEWVACDTFRAAAVEQLKVWGNRLGVHVYAGKDNADAAGLAFDAITQAKAKKTNVLCIDTAGRLHNKEHLMDELKKIIRVVRKIDATAPHTTLLVLDATTGQNAINQYETFQNEIGIDGLILTKLDGTAKGGVLVGLSEKTQCPIYYIGVGESMEDLQPFTSQAFARNLIGIESDEM